MNNILIVILIFGLIFFLLRRKLKHDKFLPYKTEDGIPRSVMITGCDTGFGNILAKDLDSLGIKVFAGCLTEKGIQDLKAKCSENLVAFTIDVTNEESVLSAFKLVQEKLNGKGLWGIVNNAGIGEDYWVEFTPFSTFKKTLNVNLLGTILVCKTFIPLLKKLRGRIVNITSLSGLIASPGMAAYSAAKFGGEGFSDSLRREMSLFGIKVCIIEPGFMKTPIVTSIPQKLSAKWNEAPEELKKEYGQAFKEATIDTNYETIEKITDDPMKVVEAIKCALFSEAPKTRYLVGKLIYVFKLLSLLPVSVLDFYFERMHHKFKKI